MLSVICDKSASYVNKLIDIGDGRDTALKQGKSKYLETSSTLMKEQIVDLGGGKFMVESEKGENKFYTCDMMSGYCSCPIGINLDKPARLSFSCSLDLLLNERRE